MMDEGVDGVADDHEVLHVEIDAVQIDMGVIHFVVFRLLWLVFILVPELKNDIVQNDPVDADFGGGLLFFLFIGGKCVYQELEIQMLIALVGDQIGFGIFQFYTAQMDVAMDDLFHQGSDLELSDMQ